MAKYNSILKTILIALILFLSVQSLAQTNVSGLISSNTTWGIAGSPYIVKGNVLVDVGVTLTIDPGVIVKFDSTKALQINGTLKAVGNSNNKILFTSSKASPVPGDWAYILFYSSDVWNAERNSIMQYCIIEYAGDKDVDAGTNGAIRIRVSLPLINYCEIRNNATVGISCWDNNNPNDTVKITNCYIHHNINSRSFAGGGMNFNMGQCIAYIYNNIIDHNTIAKGLGGQGGGIFCHANTTSQQSIVSHNIITNNYADIDGGGVSGSNTSFLFNLIYGNSVSIVNGIKGNGGGIRCSRATIFQNNIFVNNSAEYGCGAFYAWGSNIFKNNFYYNNGQTILNFGSCNTANNTIVQNTATNITVDNDPVPPSSPSDFNYNNLLNNTAVLQFNDPYLQGNDINAIYNWWGTASSSEIQGLIWDYLDDPTLSIAHFTPFLALPDTAAPIISPQNLIKTNLGGGQIKLTWNANLESDLAGYKVYWGSPTGYSFANSVDIGNVNEYTLSGVLTTDTIAVTAYDQSKTGDMDQYTGHESWFSFAKDTSNISGINKNENIIPKEYMLYQNYPNPFNPSTTISFSLPHRAFVTLKVFDLLGREISTIVSEEMDAGTYSRYWRALDNASGVYFYRIQVGKFVRTRKLVLLK